MIASGTFSKLVEIFSNKKIGIVIILLSIAARIILQLYFFDISGDRSFQLVAVKSFIEGHGFSILEVLPGNLDKQLYAPVVGWPPGYSIFLLPFYFACGKNVFAAAIFFEIVSAAAFVLVTRKILQLLNVSLWFVNIYTLISGFFIYDFAAASGSDFCTLIFFLLGIYCALLFLKKEKSPAFGIVVAAMLFLSALTRYMYAPVILLAALYLLYAGYLQNDKRIIRGGFYCLVILIFLLGCLFLYQYQVTGATTHIIETKKGFFPANLLRTNAFLFTPFVDIQFLCSSLSIFFGWDYSKQVELIWLLHLLPLIILFGACVAFLIKKAKTKRNLTDHYLHLGIISSLCIVTVLAFLSLRNAAVSDPFWTFVQEPRYYAFIVVFIHQVLFIYLFNSPVKTKSMVGKILLIIPAALLGFQLLHGFYFVSRKLLTESDNLTIHKSFKETEHFFYSSLDSLQKNIAPKKIIVTSSDPTFQNLAVLKGYKGLYQSESLNNPSSLNPFTNEMFLVILQNDALPQYKKFLQLPATKFIGTVGRYYFYVLET